jgi:hypothetical protein
VEWKKFMNNLPTARVDDILVHPREGDLIVGTHARGVWIADDITPLQQLTPEVRSQDVHLFEMRPAVAWLTDRQRSQQIGGQRIFQGENPARGAAISYYLKAAAQGGARITIADASGRIIRILTGPANAGMNRTMWNLAGPGQGGGRGAEAGGQPGTYTVTLDAEGTKVSRSLVVLEDAIPER